MALLLGKHTTGATRAKVSTILSTTRQDFYEIEILNDQDSTGILYIGPSTVASAGTNATFKLKAGQSKVIRGSMDGFQVDLTALYVVGADATTYAYISAVTADARMTVGSQR